MLARVPGQHAGAADAALGGFHHGLAGQLQASVGFGVGGCFTLSAAVSACHSHRPGGRGAVQTVGARAERGLHLVRAHGGAEGRRRRVAQVELLPGHAAIGPQTPRMAVGRQLHPQTRAFEDPAQARAVGLGELLEPNGAAGFQPVRSLGAGHVQFPAGQFAARFVVLHKPRSNPRGDTQQPGLKDRGLGLEFQPNCALLEGGGRGGIGASCPAAENVVQRPTQAGRVAGFGVFPGDVHAQHAAAHLLSGGGPNGIAGQLQHSVGQERPLGGSLPAPVCLPDGNVGLRQHAGNGPVGGRQKQREGCRAQLDHFGGGLGRRRWCGAGQGKAGQVIRSCGQAQRGIAQRAQHPNVVATGAFEQKAPGAGLAGGVVPAGMAGELDRLASLEHAVFSPPAGGAAVIATTGDFHLFLGQQTVEPSLGAALNGQLAAAHFQLGVPDPDVAGENRHVVRVLKPQGVGFDTQEPVVCRRV